jgi:Ni/Fe-hydrogenase subunit HybB-like protein
MPPPPGGQYKILHNYSILLAVLVCVGILIVSTLGGVYAFDKGSEDNDQLQKGLIMMATATFCFFLMIFVMAYLHRHHH